MRLRMSEVLKFGPKKSLSIIDVPENVEAAAIGAAHDICLYDQKACFSTQNLYYIGDSFEDFRDHLKRQLQLYAKILPKAVLSGRLLAATAQLSAERLLA